MIPAVLIVNAKARRGQDWYTQSQACLRENGVEISAAHELQDPSALSKLITESLARGVKLLIVGGGDGTLRTAASLLAHTDTALGVLPLGTVNDFARNLGIAPEVEAACRVIAEGRTERVDVGQANDDHFLITASLGFSAQTQTALTPRLKKALGPLGYVTASLLALRRLRDTKILVRSEQGEERLPALQAGVINGHFWMGGAFTIPGVDLESGRFAFYAVPPQSKKIAFLYLARDLMRRRFFHTPELRAFTSRELYLETERPQPLVLDGDLCGQTPVRLRLLPEALIVCVPADFTPPAARRE